jgi:hypothetical protein
MVNNHRHPGHVLPQQQRRLGLHVGCAVDVAVIAWAVTVHRHGGAAVSQRTGT